MKIAVTHENGNVFGHFGHTAEFKIYEVQDGKIVGARVTPTGAADTGPWPAFCRPRGWMR